MSSIDPLDRAAKTVSELKEKLRNYQLQEAIEQALDLPQSFLQSASTHFAEFRAQAIVLATRFDSNSIRADLQQRDLEDELIIRELHRFASRFLDNFISLEALRGGSATPSLEDTQTLKVVAAALRCRKNFGKAGFELGPVTLDIHEGEVVALMGPNASGKSTLLKIILGELAASDGTVNYPGLPNEKTYRAQRSHVGYVPQFLAPWQGGLRENLHYYLAARGINGTENQERVDYYLHRFRLTKYQNYTWDHISGGFRLRFALAREMLLEPRLLILDEPLAHLDIESQFDLLDIIKIISQRPARPISVVLTSQHIYETERFCSKVVVLNEGKVIAQGTRALLAKALGMSLFELEAEVPIEPLRSALNGMKIKIQGRQPIYILASTDALEMRFIIEALSSRDLSILSLRDISSSSRYFFRTSDPAI